METTTLTRLAQTVDAQRNNYCPEREDLIRELADQCRAEGVMALAIRIARVGGTAACEHHGITEVHGSAI